MSGELRRQATHYADVAIRLGMPAPPRPRITGRMRWERAVEKAKAPLPKWRPLQIAIVSDVPATYLLILRQVTDGTGVSIAEVVGPQRAPNIVKVRHHAAYRMSTELGLSLPAIGRRLGDRDHTTILYAVRKYRAYLAALETAIRPSDVEYHTIQVPRRSGGPAGTPNA